MSATLAILTVGVVPVDAVMPLLTEHIDAEQITQISLLGKMDPQDVYEDYAIEPGEMPVHALLNNGEVAQVSRKKIERDLQAVISVMDKQNYEVILLMSTERFTGLSSRHAILLEPQRIIPPLVSSIVDGHQVGVIVPLAGLIPGQKEKWQLLENAPYYEVACSLHGSDSELIAAGRNLIAKGADVLMLDCLGYHQKHRDLLQKALDVPVLLSNVLVARLASELLV
ncbi:AroM family protein [Pseudescherichia sp.]|uniref:AroM family protein n=1 Tax=Pseudescherichia sp. TaxID=2055881 RepID=UPI00289BA020|nr:AroM family protein [Pseudescherichia sp.]